MMNHMDSIATLSSSIKRHVKLVTSSGLERHLISELSRITSKLDIVSGRRSYVDALGTLDDIWAILLNSRICKELWIHVRDPFIARHQKDLFRHLKASNWGLFIPFSSDLPTPYTKVISTNSIVNNAKNIQSIVNDIIKGHRHRSIQLQGDKMPKSLEKRNCLPICPKIMINMENDLCNVLVNASGDLLERPWHKFCSVQDRLESNSAAAISYEIFKKSNYKEMKEFTILDPFCHNGSLLMELYSIFSDERVRPQKSTFPLNNFPLNYQQPYDDIPFDLPKIYSDTNISLFGTDPNPSYINLAKETQKMWMEIFETKNVQTTNMDNTEKIKLNFESYDIHDSPLTSKKVIIITNLYYGDKGRKEEFIKLQKWFCASLRLLQKRGDIEAYVIATVSFKKTSGLHWEPILRFNNNGIIVELLKLVSTKI